MSILSLRSVTVDEWGITICDSCLIHTEKRNIRKNKNVHNVSSTCCSGNPLLIRMAFNRSLRLRASSSRLPSTAAILTFENPQSLMGFTRASWEIFWPVKIWRMSGNQNTWKLRTSFPPTSNIYSKKIYELVAEDIQNGFKWYTYSGKYSCGKATWKQ